MKMKKIARIFMSFFMLLTVLLQNTVTATAAAKSDTLILEMPYGVISDADNKWAIKFSEANNIGRDVEFYARFYINDRSRKVYCVQPLIAAYDGKTYSTVDLSSLIGNGDVETYLGYISAVGYGYRGDTSDEMDWATQIRVWQYLHEWAPDHFPSISNIDSSIQAKIDTINERLKAMTTSPSFNGQTLTFAGIGEDYAITLTDANDVYLYYKFYQ